MLPNSSIEVPLCCNPDHSDLHSEFTVPIVQVQTRGQVFVSQLRTNPKGLFVCIRDKVLRDMAQDRGILGGMVQESGKWQDESRN